MRESGFRTNQRGELTRQNSPRNTVSFVFVPPRGQGCESHTFVATHYSSQEPPFGHPFPDFFG